MHDSYALLLRMTETEAAALDMLASIQRYRRLVRQQIERDRTVEPSAPSREVMP